MKDYTSVDDIERKKEQEEIEMQKRNVLKLAKGVLNGFKEKKEETEKQIKERERKIKKRNRIIGVVLILISLFLLLTFVTLVIGEIWLIKFLIKSL